ncbi:MAG TPA: hypothetical protein VH107_16695 [Lacipirellulaceae bacterium]|jgi:uncharacterized protein involved in exopolysaccharide biosynthesis|nr:hypothetical protein [Lacipirellulaceae bacterium]
MATARFAIEPPIPQQLIAGRRMVLGRGESDPFKEQQLTLLTCDSLLSNAVCSADLKSLAIFRNVRDPVSWLRKRVQIVFPQDGVLAISLAGANRDKHDLTITVNAVANAYNEELAAQRETTQPVTRDLLSRSLTGLRAEIKRKIDEYQDIEREAGPLKPEDEDPLSTLDTKQIWTGIDRLNHLLSNSYATSNAQSPAFRDEVKSQLKIYREVLDRRLTGGYPMSVRKQDLKQLHILANDMEEKLAKLDQHLLRSFQIRQLQPATITFDDPIGIPNTAQLP